MKWRQDAKTGEMVPIDQSAANRDRGFAIHGVFEPFVSVVDGSVISTANQLREHNVRNGVVNAAEFSDAFYEGKAKERADFFEGKTTTRETFKRRQAIYETWINAERQA